MFFSVKSELNLFNWNIEKFQRAYFGRGQEFSQMWVNSYKIKHRKISASIIWHWIESFSAKIRVTIFNKTLWCLNLSKSDKFPWNSSFVKISYLINVGRWKIFLGQIFVWAWGFMSENFPDPKINSDQYSFQIFFPGNFFSFWRPEHQ